MVRCELCGLWEDDILQHLKELHNIEEEVNIWPDGHPVIVDLTIDPEDFNA